jgi:hypothetical protein
MQIRLVREILTAQSTIGRLYVNDAFKCWTLEDVDRELTTDMPLADIQKIKVYGRTAIPRGSYRVIVNMSNRFKRMMPLLCDVPGFAGIRIHAGRIAEHTEGCVLTGMSHGENQIFNPRQAYGLLFPVLDAAHTAGEPISIAIVKSDIQPLPGVPPVPAIQTPNMSV